MKKYEKILSAVKTSHLVEIIKLGFQPKEIKELVIESFEPYFENKDILERFAIEALLPEFVAFCRLQKDKQSIKIFEKCLSTYRSAKAKDPQRCFESCAMWQPYIVNSVSRFWSVFHLEVDKDILPIEEFLHECLRNIGDIVEGLTKPYLKALLHQIRIAGGIKTSVKYINSLSLGTIIAELINESGYPDLFMPPPWSIRLNQWRNIAYHHTARIENHKIICWYGEAPNIKKKLLSRDELAQVVRMTFKVYETLKLAYSLFYVDNVKEINILVPAPIKVRTEAQFLNFATALASQGFEIVDYTKNPDEAKLVVRDVSDLNPDVRRFHASQFLFHLWLLTKSKRVTVEYREKDNTLNFLVSAKSSICEKIYNGELETLILAKKMDIVFLKK